MTSEADADPAANAAKWKKYLCQYKHEWTVFILVWCFRQPYESVLHIMQARILSSPWWVESCKGAC